MFSLCQTCWKIKEHLLHSAAVCTKVHVFYRMFGVRTRACITKKCQRVDWPSNVWLMICRESSTVSSSVLFHTIWPDHSCLAWFAGHHSTRHNQQLVLWPECRGDCAYTASSAVCTGEPRWGLPSRLEAWWCHHEAWPQEVQGVLCCYLNILIFWTMFGQVVMHVKLSRDAPKQAFCVLGRRCLVQQACMLHLHNNNMQRRSQMHM